MPLAELLDINILTHSSENKLSPLATFKQHLHTSSVLGGEVNVEVRRLITWNSSRWIWSAPTSKLKSICWHFYCFKSNWENNSGSLKGFFSVNLGTTSYKTTGKFPVLRMSISFLKTSTQYLQISNTFLINGSYRFQYGRQQ